MEVYNKHYIVLDEEENPALYTMDGIPRERIRVGEAVLPAAVGQVSH